MTIATTGYGTTCQIDNAAGALTSIGEVKRVKPFGISLDTVEASHLTSPNAFKEFVAALKDVGQATFTVNHDQKSATDVLLRTAIDDRGVRTFKVTFPDTETFQCECFVVNYEVGDISPDDVVTADVTLKFTGAPTFS